MPAAFFSVLGITPTPDQKSIRRAYAVALKKIDQAANPEGFAALREAYERARAWADGQSSTATPFSAPTPHPAERPEPDVPPAPLRRSRPDEPAPESPSESTPASGQAPDTSSPDRRRAPRRSARQTHDARSRPDPTPASDHTLPSATERAEAVAHWTGELMAAADDQVQPLLDRALLDERLTHLDARQDLAASLAHAIRARPSGRLALFNTARRAFDWNGLNAPFPSDPELSRWLGHLHDQMELYVHLPPEQRVPLDAVLALARKRAKPSRVDAVLHGEQFERLYLVAPELAMLDLGEARITAWRSAIARAERIRRLADWPAKNKLLIVLGIVVILGLAAMYRDARDGTTYRPDPAKMALADTRITLQAQRAAAAVRPCDKQVQSPPLGCPALINGQSEPWPLDTPKVLVITEKPDLRYPYEAQINGFTGPVWVRVLLDEQGQVQRTALLFSSNHADLDVAAVNAAQAVRLMPATRDGKPVPSQVLLMFDYKLDKR